MCMVYESGPHARERNQSQARGGKTNTHRPQRDPQLQYRIAQSIIFATPVRPALKLLQTNVTIGIVCKNNWIMEP